MLTDYIRAAMRHAKYEILTESGTFYGTVPDFQGVWANASTLDDCREELQQVLEDWILLAIRRGDRLPIVDGLDLNARDAAEAMPKIVVAGILAGHLRALSGFCS